VRAKKVTDGLSHTLVVGECSARALSATHGESRIDGAFPNGWITGTTATGTPPTYHSGIAPPSWNITTMRYPINLRNYDLPGIDDNRGANNPLASEHPGGAHVLLADGAVQFRVNSTSVQVLKQLSTRDDGGTTDASE
jgi:prepilin-type processing-associated H-X9-DG protein